MGIREKTLAGLIAIFAVVTIILLILSLTIFLDSYRNIESKDMTKSMDLILVNIHHGFLDLQKTTNDWAVWDDDYSFAQGKDPAFLKDNLGNETYDNLHVNFIVITNASGAIIYGQSYNFTDENFEPLPQGLSEEIESGSSLLVPSNGSRQTSGFVVLPAMIVMAASSSIVHSDQSGIPDGTIVMGRYFGNEEIKNFGILSNPSPVISQITSADLSGPSVHVAPVTEDTIEGRTTVRDISGNDAFVISYTASREFYQQGKETIQFFLMIQLAIMLMLGLFIFYRLDSSILTRLDTIIADTRAVSDGITKRIRKSGDDEIAQLAESINQMLGRVDKSHRDHLDSEEKFRSFTQESTDSYVLLDRTGNVLEWNAAAERITGITRNEALGTSAIEIHTRLIPPEYKTPERTENIRQAFASFIKTGEFAGFCKPIEIEIIRPDGTRRTVQQITFPIRISGDWLMGVITRDITEHRLAEEALQQARKKMNMLNTITFQDIQNAIFALSGYHELAGKFITGPEGKGILEKEETILKKIEHSLTIAKNFQNLGINPPKWQGVNQVFIFALSHLDLKQITKTVKVDDLEIYADPLLEKVFTNLLENSIQHGESVTAISLLYRKTRTILEIIYEDNGKGIPSKKKESVFERGHSPDLGLFLVREILSITGITIQEIGIEGQGARFIITVPEGLYRFGGDRH